MPKALNVRKTVLPGLVIALALWAIFNILFRPDFWTISHSDSNKLQGCYSAGGKLLFEIRGNVLISEGKHSEYTGVREKNRDVLSFVQPLRLSAAHDAVEYAGTLTKLPIMYANRNRLQLFTAAGEQVDVVQGSCQVLGRPQ